MKKLMLAFSIILVMALLIVGCSNSETTTTATTATSTTSTATSTTTTTTTPSGETPQYGGTLRIMDTRAPGRSLGWFAESGAQFLAPCYPAIETLLRVTFQNEVVPFLAESYEVADDLSSITFVLHQGVKFHDGSDFNAEVAKWNLDQQIAAQVSNASTWDSVDIIDEYTIRLNLNSWKNSIFNNLACTASATMVSKKAFDEVGAEGLRWEPVGTGAYKFESFQRDVSVKFTKFDDYWQEGKPYLDAIEYSFSSDPMTEIAAIQNNEADTLGDNVGQTMVTLLESEQGSYLMVNPSGIADLMPDSANANSPWSNLKVRQALDYAIDRDAIVAVRGFGYSEPVFQFAYPGTPAYITDLEKRSYDPEKAKALLTEAGYPDGFDTTMWVDSSSADKDSFTAIQNFMMDVGIRAEFNWIDNATAGNLRSSGWENGLLCGILGLDANLNNSIGRYFIKATPYCPCIIKTDAFDAQWAESLNTKAYDAERVQAMVQYLYDNALACCLWTVNHANFCQSYVHGGGWMSMQTWPGWTPENAWMSAK